MFGLSTKDKLKNIQESQAQTLGIVLEMNAKTDAEKKAAQKIISRGKTNKRELKKVSKLEKKKTKQDRKNAKEAAKTKKRLAKLTAKQNKAKDKILENKSKEVSQKINEAKESVGDTSGNAKGKTSGTKKGLGKLFNKLGSGISKVADKLNPFKKFSEIKSQATGVVSNEPSQSMEGNNSNVVTEANASQTSEITEKVNEANAANLKATTAINSLTQSKLNLIREDTEDIKATVMEQAADDSDKTEQKKMLEKFDDDLSNINDATDTLVQNDIDEKDAGQKKDKDLIKRLNQLHSNLLEKVEEKATAFYKVWYGIRLFFSKDFWGLLHAGLIGLGDLLIKKIASLFNFFNPHKQVDVDSLLSKSEDASGKYTNKERVNYKLDALKGDYNNAKYKMDEEETKFKNSKDYLNASEEDKIKKLEEFRKQYQDELEKKKKAWEDAKDAKKLGKLNVNNFGKSDAEIAEANNNHKLKLNEYINQLRGELNSGKIPTIYDIYASENSPLYDYISKLDQDSKAKLRVPINSNKKDVEKALKLLYKLVDDSNQGNFTEDAYKVAPNKDIKNWFMDKLLDYQEKSNNKDTVLNPIFEDENQLIPFTEFMKDAETSSDARYRYLSKKDFVNYNNAVSADSSDFAVGVGLDEPMFATTNTDNINKFKSEADKVNETTNAPKNETKREVVEKETNNVVNPVFIGVTEAKSDQVNFGYGNE